MGLRAMGEILPHTDVAIVGGHIAFVGPDAKHAIGEGTQVIEAHGRYLVPGLLDAHMHVEFRHGDGHGVRARRCAAWDHRHVH